MSTVWMVRAGRAAEYIDDFVSNEHVAIGWPQLGPLAEHVPKGEIEARMRRAFPTAKQGTIVVWVGNVYRFLHDIAVGDSVTTFDPERRLYYVGKITSAPQWREHALPRVRKVKWEAKTPRDVLSVSTRNALGSIVSLFKLGAEAAAELREKAVAMEAGLPVAPPSPEAEEVNGEGQLLEDTLTRADEFIEDKIVRLGWEEIQELVAGILRALGYRTKVSDPGADRGVDVFASPDGLGLAEPRIFVEVKHQPNTPIGAQQVRSFLGGRKSGDRCLYVSTGGFTREARYEADRSVVPLTLLTLAELRQLLVDHYERLDATTTSFLPLRRLYWPVD